MQVLETSPRGPGAEPPPLTPQFPHMSLSFLDHTGGAGGNARCLTMSDNIESNLGNDPLKSKPSWPQSP